jgi:hypothetical protein
VCIYISSQLHATLISPLLSSFTLLPLLKNKTNST